MAAPGDKSNKIEQNPLEKEAERLRKQEGPPVTKESVKSAYEAVLAENQRKYIELSNDPDLRFYVKYNENFLASLADQKAKLDDEVDKLTGKQTEEKQRILSESADLTPEIKNLWEKHIKMMKAEKEALRLTDPERVGAAIDDYEDINDDDKMGFGRLTLAGSQAALLYLDPKKADEQFQEAKNAFTRSNIAGAGVLNTVWEAVGLDEHLSDAAVRKIVGEGYLSQLQQYGLNSQSKGFLAAYLTYGREILGKDANSYDRYLFAKLAELKDKPEFRAARADRTRIPHLDEEIPTSMLPLELIQSPLEWKEQMLGKVRAKFKNLKKICDSEIFPTGDPTSGEYLQFVKTQEKDIDVTDEEKIDEFLLKAQQSVQDNLRKTVPGNFEKQATDYKQKIDALKAQVPSGLTNEEWKKFNDFITDLKTRTTQLMSLDIDIFTPLVRLEELWHKEFLPIQVDLNGLNAQIDAAAEANKKKAEAAKPLDPLPGTIATPGTTGESDAGTGTNGGTDSGSGTTSEEEAKIPLPKPAPEEKEKSESEIITENWNNGRPTENPFADFDGKLVVREITALRRDNDGLGGDGEVVDSISADEEVTLKRHPGTDDRKGAPLSALRVQGKNTVIVYVRVFTDRGNAYWISSERLRKVAGLSPKLDESPDQGPGTLRLQKSAADLLSQYPELGEVNLNYVELLERLAAYREEADGVEFSLPFNNGYLACRFLKENGKYTLYYKGGKWPGFSGVNELMKKINDGRVQQALMREKLMHKTAYKAYEVEAGELDGSPTETQEGYKPIHIELDWNYPDPDILIWPQLYGRVKYRFYNRKNVGIHGGPGNDVREGTAESLDEFLKVVVPHVRKRSEGPEQPAGENLETKKEIIFNALSNPKTFMHPEVEKRIGRVVDFEILPNEVNFMRLDWGGGNSLKKQDNAWVQMRANDKGTITYWVEFRDKNVHDTRRDASSLKEVFDDLEKMRKGNFFSTPEVRAESSKPLPTRLPPRPERKNYEGFKSTIENSSEVSRFLSEKNLVETSENGRYRYQLKFPPRIKAQGEAIEIHFDNPDIAGFEEKFNRFVVKYLRNFLEKMERELKGKFKPEDLEKELRGKSMDEIMVKLAPLIKDFRKLIEPEIQKWKTAFGETFDGFILEFSQRPTAEELKDAYHNKFIPAWKETERKLDEFMKQEGLSS